VLTIHVYVTGYARCSARPYAPAASYARWVSAACRGLVEAVGPGARREQPAPDPRCHALIHGPCHFSHWPGTLLSKGGLQHAMRRLRRVRRGAADGDKHSCQETAYRHGGEPERLQCSRRAPQRAGEAEAGRVPEGRAAGGAQIWHRTCGSLRDKGWHLTRCGWPETCCSPQRRGRTSARGSQRARPTPRPLAQCSCRTTSSGFAARRPLFLCARGNEISFVALT
jgi:hypothetical protein